jgi:hypothetical protein
VPDLDFSGPWDGTEPDGSLSTPFLQSQIRQTWGGGWADGFADDGAAGYLASVTATGTDTTVNVHFFNGVIRGIHVKNGSTDLDVEDSGGTTPTSGQTRIDRVIIRLDFAAQTGELLVLCGTPASSGAVAPTLTQQDDLDGIWEHELAQIRRVGNVAVTQAMISLTGQRFIAPTVYATANAVVQGVKTLLGTITFTDHDITAYRRTIGGDHTSLQHKSILDPDWTACTLSTSTWEILSSNRAFQYRLRGGVLEITGEAHKKTSTGALSATGWTMVCTVPVASIPGVAVSQFMHVTCHDSSGDQLSWRLVVPASGVANLQVKANGPASVSTVGLSLFQIPVGA